MIYFSYLIYILIFLFVLILIIDINIKKSKNKRLCDENRIKKENERKSQRKENIIKNRETRLEKIKKLKKM